MELLLELREQSGRLEGGGEGEEMSDDLMIPCIKFNRLPARFSLSETAPLLVTPEI